jgi:hypothetical protein
VIEWEKQKPVHSSSDRGVIGVVLHTFPFPAFVTCLIKPDGVGRNAGAIGTTTDRYVMESASAKSTSAPAG